MRVTVTNDSPEPWTFDQGEQRIELAERGARIYSEALTATGERPPVVVVPAAHALTFDLSFPVGTRDDASDLPGFTFLWTVRAGGEVAAGRIVFARKMERVMTMVPADLPPYRMPANPANDRRDPCRP